MAESDHVEWVTVTRRTNDPKLSFLEKWLDQMGVLHRRNGSSTHAPIMQVPVSQSEEAYATLEMVIELGEGVRAVFDDIADDHPFFGYVASPSNPG